jgi:hypothetical protein
VPKPVLRWPSQSFYERRQASPIKEFTTAIKAAEESEEESTLEFAVDGVMCKAYRPNDGQLAYLMASTGRHQSDQEQVAGIINFFVAVLDDDSHTYLVNRLLDRKDQFGLEQVQKVMEWMVSEWSGRPTKRPSVSTTSPPNTGQSSTEAAPALT